MRVVRCHHPVNSRDIYVWQPCCNGTGFKIVTDSDPVDRFDNICILLTDRLLDEMETNPAKFNSVFDQARIHQERRAAVSAVEGKHWTTIANEVVKLIGGRDIHVHDFSEYWRGSAYPHVERYYCSYRSCGAWRDA